jgi:hypothetical protein
VNLDQMGGIPPKGSGIEVLAQWATYSICFQFIFETNKWISNDYFHLDLFCLSFVTSGTGSNSEQKFT